MRGMADEHIIQKFSLIGMPIFDSLASSRNSNKNADLINRKNVPVYEKFFFQSWPKENSEKNAFAGESYTATSAKLKQ